MEIRRAKKEDIARLSDLLSQVLEIHAKLRPDLFMSGTTKYNQEQLEEMIKIHFHTNEPWDLLSHCATLGEIFDIVVEDMDRQSRGLKG